MITRLANLNADIQTDADWRYLLAHDVTLTWRERGGTYIAHGKLSRDHNDDFALSHNGLRWRYHVTDRNVVTDIDPGDARLVRLAHRANRCRLCAALQGL